MRKLLQDEREIRVARQHWSIFIPVVGGCLVVVGVLAGLAVVAPSHVSGLALGSVKTFALALGLAGAAMTLTVRWLRWHYTTFTLTDRRVVVGTGVLSRHTESIALDRVQDTAVRQSLVARMFRAGDVEIESAGRDGSEVLARIHDPQGFSNDLLNAVEAHRTGRPYGADEPSTGAAAPQRYAPPGASEHGPPPGYGPPPRRDGL
ncbi:MAG TPA: PH domain-containing protein [Candidatus Dormibacteraeota bacterium]|nr:PH domain-containing protein [Candidatus Dormibacteraeota bacterium]